MENVKIIQVPAQETIDGLNPKEASPLYHLSGLSQLDVAMSLPVESGKQIGDVALQMHFRNMETMLAAAPGHVLQEVRQRQLIDQHNAQIEQAKAQKKQLRQIAKQARMPVEAVKRMVKSVRRV